MLPGDQNEVCGTCYRPISCDVIFCLGSNVRVTGGELAFVFALYIYAQVVACIHSELYLY